MLYGKKSVLRKVQRKKLVLEPLFLITSQVLASLLKRKFWHRCFPMNFCEIFQNTLFVEHLWWLLLKKHELIIFQRFPHFPIFSVSESEKKPQKTKNKQTNTNKRKTKTKKSMYKMTRSWHGWWYCIDGQYITIFYYLIIP